MRYPAAHLISGLLFVHRGVQAGKSSVDAKSTIKSIAKNALTDSHGRQAQARTDFFDKMACGMHLSLLFEEGDTSPMNPLSYIRDIENASDDFWTENCKLDKGMKVTCSLYDEANFDDVEEQCDGWVELFDYYLSSEEGSVTLTGMPICMGDTCSYGDVFFMMNSIFDNFVDEQDSEGATHFRFSDTTGLQCFTDTMDNYGLKLIMDSKDEEQFVEVLYVDPKMPLMKYSPGKILDFENTELIGKACNPPTDTEDGSESICNMRKVLDHDHIKSLCDDADGEYNELDLHIEVGTAKYKFLHFPLCQAKSCAFDEEGIEYMDFVLEAVTYLDIDIDILPDEGCAENKKSKFMFTMKDGEAVTKSCNFLRKRSEDMMYKKCDKKWAPEGYETASDVCPVTCGDCCRELDRNRFLTKKWEKDGVMKIHTKTCKWLAGQDEETITKLCKKNTFHDKFGPAYNACPMTCGVPFCNWDDEDDDEYQNDGAFAWYVGWPGVPETSIHYILGASYFQYQVAGENAVPRTYDYLNIGGDPGSDEYGTVEVEWLSQDGKEKRFYGYLEAKNGIWRMNEARIYDEDEEWKYFEGDLMSGNVGECFKSDLLSITNDDGDEVLFKDLRFMPFLSSLDMTWEMKQFLMQSCLSDIFEE